MQHVAEIFDRTVGNISSTRSKLGRDDIKWQELLTHFRALQSKHEKARRQAMGAEITFSPVNGEKSTPNPAAVSATASGSRPPMRRKVTGGDSTLARPPSRTGPVLSPLNPRARGQGTSAAPAVMQPPGSPTSSQTQQSKPRRTLSIKS